MQRNAACCVSIPSPCPPCRADLHRVPSNCPSTAGLDTSTPSVGPLAWLFLSVQPPSRQPSTGPLLPYRPFPICKPSRRCWVPCSSLPPSPALPDNGHERVQHIGRRPPPTAPPRPASTPPVAPLCAWRGEQKRPSKPILVVVRRSPIWRTSSLARLEQQAGELGGVAHLRN